MHELHWGLPVILYLFLGGLGAGAGAVSASVLLRSGGGDRPGSGFDIARWGALIAPFPVIVGTGMIVFELGSFQAGNWFRFVNLFKVINLSPMSIGTWLLSLFILVSLAYAYTFFMKDPRPGDARHSLRKMLAWAMVPLGVGVALYTGILLGALPARPFWNSPILALLFLVSALSTGVAAILLARAIFREATHHQEVARSTYLMTSSDLLLIAFEIAVVFLFIMYAHLTIGNTEAAVAVILGGRLTSLFWLGFVALGLAIPAAIELKYVIPTLLYQKQYVMPRSIEIAVCTLVLIGGFMLRYIVVVAGQITGPVGI
ncbi:NrfD/PsrC family molybdoenzyme membrane anchor subunit [Varunaivibrio sulfuroxidans]|uniref:Formate-dependent nitrite reductase membrane component NrfD n=1 Tax=Varunaivibrio sulfuroxidans TaxID=1773489 RepID=A0A4R3J428_9PROT|nr:NrfD/PsrC family molybdoenzyme membrane anchor subunit [Varunaivibrio sulfuroxidans]TCS60558.1 formate-dependent nitrite reductase membrane component NrfD [Varunaivibrio sulfuroxidans]WES30048.1 polysulfide reductase NrfD [Varunaivibrio sulfuroxidans]